MKRKIIVSIISIVLVCVVVFLLVKLANKDKVNNKDLSSIVNFVYENVSEDIKSNWENIQGSNIDLTNNENILYNTGLKNVDKINSIFVSEPLDQYYSYSFVCISLEKGADIEAIKTDICNNMDMYKWKYVYAKKLAVVNAGNYIFAVMGTTDEVDAVISAINVYADANKLVTGKIMQKLEE